MSVETVEEAHVVRVRGEFDLATAPDFAGAVEGLDPSHRLVVDLSECTFLDSSALRALLVAARARTQTGGSAAVVAGPPGILRVLEIARVADAIPVVATVDEALG